jgi:hypothetical protein
VQAGSLSCVGIVFLYPPPALHDGSGACRAFVPAAGASVAKRPLLTRQSAFRGNVTTRVGPGVGVRQALRASVPPNLTIQGQSALAWNYFPIREKVPSGLQAALRGNLCCWTWWSPPWGPGLLPGAGENGVKINYTLPLSGDDWFGWIICCRMDRLDCSVLSGLDLLLGGCIPS